MTSYNPLTLYYLNQMGIVPWVKRTKEQETSTLVVALSSSKNQKTATLLNNILAFIGLPLEGIRILYNFKDLKTLESASSSALLLLGVNSTEQGFNCPCFLAADLEFVLKNPNQKKQLFKTLLSLKAHLIQQGLCA